MNDSAKSILKGFLSYIAIAVSMTALTGLYRFSIAHPLPIENWTEVAQEACLALTTAVLAACVMRDRTRSAGICLVCGFFGCMFLRELDALFDLIVHGAWKYFVCAWLALVGLATWKLQPRTILPGLAGFIRSPAFPLMAFAVAGIMVYSRLIGFGGFWKLFAGSGCTIYPIKEMVEESHELLFYFMALVSSVTYFLRPR